jgi:alpha-tubulin suppressor-like RCC1 family protein
MRDPRIPFRLSWLAFALGFVLAGCEGDVTAPGGERVVAVLMQPSAFSLIVGEARKIDALPKNPNGTVLVGRSTAWSNSAPEVVAINDAGFVTALAVGEATITAEIEGVSATVVVTVRPPPVGLWRDHTCAVSLSARVYCWGRGINGQIGDGMSATALVPTRVEFEAGRDWVTVASGAGHSCALDVAGVVACWGRGIEGQLGGGDNQGSARPVTLETGFQFRAITAGGRHTCGLSARNAQSWCWGWNPSGQVGNGTTVTVSTPVVVLGVPELAQISAGGRHTCGVAVDAGLWCWGGNGSGQIGDGSTDDRLTPVRVAPALDFVAVSAGAHHTCAIDTGGALHCWGDNRSGQLGDGGLADNLSPTLVTGGLTFTRVSSGAVHTCAVASDQRAYCWGLGSFGRLGTGSEILVANPVEVGGGAIYTRIFTGTAHGCAITFADTMKCWGFGGSGQLGNGETGNTNVPVDPLGTVFFARFGG